MSSADTVISAARGDIADTGADISIGASRTATLRLWTFRRPRIRKGAGRINVT